MAETLKVASYRDLLKHEPEILKRIAAFPNGGNLFMIHPFLLLADVHVELSDKARREILAAEPSLSGLSSAPYQALKNSKSQQTYQIRLKKGLFRRRKA